MGVLGYKFGVHCVCEKIQKLLNKAVVECTNDYNYFSIIITDKTTGNKLVVDKNSEIKIKDITILEK